MISQFTPYTCFLDCLSSYLREIGLDVFSSDILTNHRDLCLNDLDQETFGAIDLTRFQTLAARYLLVANELPVDNESAIAALLAQGYAVFMICSRFDGTDNHGHALRVVGIDKDQYHLLSPSFPHGQRKLASSHTLKVDWWAKCIWIKPI